MVHSGITMVASDFYNLNAHYKTKFVPQTSDSKSILLSVLEYYVPTQKNSLLVFSAHKFNILTHKQGKNLIYFYKKMEYNN